MAWDVDHDEFISFVHICSTHLNRNEYVYVVFDLLYIDGQGAAEAFQKAGVQPCKVRRSQAVSQDGSFRQRVGGGMEAAGSVGDLALAVVMDGVVMQPQELKDRPLEERRRLLKAVVEEKEKRLEMVECEEVRGQDTTRRQEAIQR